MLKVLYILGYARSGTTILGNLLGEVEGCFHMGEAHHLWVRASRDERNRCGCGVPLAECEVWGPVLDEVAREIVRRGWVPGAAPTTRACIRQVSLWQGTARRSWRTLASLRSSGPGAAEAERRYLGAVETLYSATASETGAQTLIDSSKLPGPATLLRKIPGVMPYFVHIVRDPRGVVLSRLRGRPGRAQAQRVYPLPLGHTVAESLRWLRRNIDAELIARRLPSPNHLFTTYEGLVADPVRTLNHILGMLGEPRPQLPFLHHGSAVLNRNHTIGGNRNRFSSGVVTLRVDDGWHRTLRRSDRWLIGALTGVGLFRYGYIPSRKLVATSAVPAPQR